MSDDESARPAAEPAPAEPTAPNPAAPQPAGSTPSAEPDSAPEPARAPGPDTESAEPAVQVPAAAEPAVAASGLAVPALAVAEPARAPGRATAFLKANVATLVLAVLLVGAIVWGVLGAVSANDWESRATALSSDLASAEKTLAEAEATIDDLETAKSRAESTATACVGAIDDADAMLEVSAKLDDKTVVYLAGLNDFMAAINAGNFAAAEIVGTEMDKLTVQIEDLSTQIEGHIDDYGDAAEGCHVDVAQDV